MPIWPMQIPHLTHSICEHNPVTKPTLLTLSSLMNIHLNDTMGLSRQIMGQVQYE
jgi:hypothetical protein